MQNTLKRLCSGVEMSSRVAVLVDGDNLSVAHASQIMAVATARGSVELAHAYGNAQTDEGWHAAQGFRVIHAGIGPNGSDLLLCIDAMELAIADGFETFVIASADRNFSHLAHRLRKHGVAVIGMGNAQSLPAYRASCTEFVAFGAAAAVGSRPALDAKIREILARADDKTKGMPIDGLKETLQADGEFKISDHAKSWRKYLSDRPELFEIDHSRPEPWVRNRPAKLGAKHLRVVR